jgi:T3SS (YopN, CesT) and YbjN peptide-binding chaperone 1
VAEDTPAVKSLRELCRKYLDESSLKYLRDTDEHFVLPFDQIMVHVFPNQWGEDQTVVLVAAVTNQGMRIDADLHEFICVQNANILFGKLCLYKELQQVRFEHALLGDFLNRDELTTAVKVVAASAIAFEPQIKQRWGGE